MIQKDLVCVLSIININFLVFYTNFFERQLLKLKYEKLKFYELILLFVIQHVLHKENIVSLVANFKSINTNMNVLQVFKYCLKEMIITILDTTSAQLKVNSRYIVEITEWVN